MDKKNTHLFLKDIDNGTRLDFKVDNLSLLLDLKVLMNEYYLATFTQDESGLTLSFNNGQKFNITVTEIN